MTTNTAITVVNDTTGIREIRTFRPSVAELFHPGQKLEPSEAEEIFYNVNHILLTREELIKQLSQNSHYGASNMYRPANLHYIREHLRQESLKEPNDPYLNKNYKELAEAGLFWTPRVSEITDLVVCFYCSKSMCVWLDDDIPIYEHAKWYPNCKYVNLKMGNLFVLEVLKNEVALKNDSSSYIPPKELCEKFKLKPPNREKSSCTACFDETLCKICYEYEKNCVISPCGHVICTNCAINVPQCPVCRTGISNLTKIYTP